MTILTYLFRNNVIYRNMGRPKKWPNDAIKQQAHYVREEYRAKGEILNDEQIKAILIDKGVFIAKNETKKNNVTQKSKVKVRKVKSPKEAPKSPKIYEPYNMDKEPELPDEEDIPTTITEEFVQKYLITTALMTPGDPRVAAQLVSWIEKKGALAQTESDDLQLTKDDIAEFIDEEEYDPSIEIGIGDEI